jgi:putative membrane protein insertion efficiency factor
VSAAGRAQGAFLATLVGLPRRLLLLLLRGYRLLLAPLTGGRCRYLPSCSCYAEEAIARHGALRGAGLAAWRLLRCHPFARGGLDPVPEPRAAGGPSFRAESSSRAGSTG